MALPSNVSFCQVTGRFLSAVVDSSDPDRDPDAVPLADLRVLFTPELSPAVVRNAGAVPPALLAIDAAGAVTDADGVLVDSQGVPGVFLVASDDPDLDPSGWTWRADIRTPQGFALMAFSFMAPSGGTVDLSSVVPVPPNPGEDLAAWEAAVAATAANAAAAAASAGDAAGSAAAAAASEDVATDAASVAGDAAAAAGSSQVAAAGSASAAAGSAVAAAGSADDAADAVAGFDPLNQPVYNAEKIGVNAPAPSERLEVAAAAAGEHPAMLVRALPGTANTQARLHLESVNSTGVVIRQTISSVGEAIRVDLPNLGGPGQQYVAFRFGGAEFVRIHSNRLVFQGSTGPVYQFGSAAPEGAVAGAMGSIYLRTSGGAGTTLYVKESGVPGTNTGWVPVGWSPTGIINAGSIGVNAPAPTALLDVAAPNATSDATVNLRPTGTTGQKSVLTLRAGYAGVQSDHTITGDLNDLRLSTGMSGGMVNQKIVFQISATEKMRVIHDRVIFGGATGPALLWGATAPEAAVTAPVGSIYLRSGGGAATSFYVKESGTGNTGWGGEVMDVSATHLEQLRMSAAVERSLESAAQLSPLDSAAVALLRHAAAHIDQVTDKGGMVDSPTLNSFMRICTELGLTPLARGEVKPSGESGSVRGARLVALQDGRRRA